MQPMNCCSGSRIKERTPGMADALVRRTEKSGRRTREGPMIGQRDVAVSEG